MSEHDSAASVASVTVVDGNAVDKNIRRSFDALKEFLNQKVPLPTGWVRLWGKYADLLWFAGLVSSLWTFVYASDDAVSVSGLIKAVVLLAIAALWLALAAWISKRNNTKRMNTAAIGYKVLYSRLLDVFEAFGWLGKSQHSMASRKLVTPAHIKALNELLNDSERQRRICEEGQGFEEFSRCYSLNQLRVLGLKYDWPFTERIALLCKNVEKTAEKYDAVLASVGVARQLRNIAAALQANSPAGLAPSATLHRDSALHLAALIDEDADGGVVTPLFDNGLTDNQAAAFVGQLQGTADYMSELRQGLMAQLKLD